MPYLNQIKSHGYTLAFIGSGIAAAIILTMLVFSVFSVTKEKYAIDVQAVKDEEDLFNTARVAVTNTGKLPLTNVIVNYGAVLIISSTKYLCFNQERKSGFHHLQIYQLNRLKLQQIKV